MTYPALRWNNRQGELATVAFAPWTYSVWLGRRRIQRGTGPGFGALA